MSNQTSNIPRIVKQIYASNKIFEKILRTDSKLSVGRSEKFTCPFCGSKKLTQSITCGERACRAQNERQKKAEKLCRPKLKLPWNGINNYLQQCREAEKRQHATNPFA